MRPSHPDRRDRIYPGAHSILGTGYPGHHPSSPTFYSTTSNRLAARGILASCDQILEGKSPLWPVNLDSLILHKARVISRFSLHVLYYESAQRHGLPALWPPFHQLQYPDFKNGQAKRLNMARLAIYGHVLRVNEMHRISGQMRCQCVTHHTWLPVHSRLKNKWRCGCVYHRELCPSSPTQSD